MSLAVKKFELLKNTVHMYIYCIFGYIEPKMCDTGCSFGEINLLLKSQDSIEKIGSVAKFLELS